MTSLPSGLVALVLADMDGKAAAVLDVEPDGSRSLILSEGDVTTRAAQRVGEREGRVVRVPTAPVAGVAAGGGVAAEPMAELAGDPAELTTGQARRARSTRKSAERAP